jgi:hypothetical protein
MPPGGYPYPSVENTFYREHILKSDTFENVCLLAVTLTLLKVQVLHGGDFVAL